jgi:hypothetical protein
MAQKNLPKQLVDIKGLLKSQWVSGLSKHLNAYEKKVKELVHELDLKSRDARDKSRKQLDQFTLQLKKTRTEVEKKVLTIVNQESHRLNKGLSELVTYLKSVAKSEAGKIEVMAKAPKSTKSAKGMRAKTQKKTSKKNTKKSSLKKSEKSAVSPLPEAPSGLGGPSLSGSSNFQN